MKPIQVKDILEVCQGAELVCGNPETVCTNFSKDTRTLNKGDVYVGIKGERFDGNTLYQEAIENGASICILQGVTLSEDEKKKYENCAIVLVEDTIQAIQAIATYKRSLYDIPVVAITGSVGKTSTKDLIASVLAEKYKVLKTEGNLNNHIGVPMTILRLKDEELLVVEMGMDHAGEIRRLTNIAKPTVAVITNVGTSHIGQLGSQEAIFNAKLEILEGLSEDGTVVINNDNELLHNWYVENKETYPKTIVTYGIENKSDIMAENITLQEEGSTFIAKTKEDTFEINVPVAGEHFVYNSLCATCVAKVQQEENEKIQAGIQKVELTKRRMDIQTIGKYTVINDCYNANYDSMKAAIRYLGSTHKGTKIAILGDMLNLGEYSEDLHRKVGQEAEASHVDIVITVGFFSQYINEEAKSAQNIHCQTNEEAIEEAKKIMKPDSCILVKASNSMKFDEIANQLIEYLQSL